MQARIGEDIKAAAEDADDTRVLQTNDRLVRIRIAGGDLRPDRAAGIGSGRRVAGTFGIPQPRVGSTVASARDCCSCRDGESVGPETLSAGANGAGERWALLAGGAHLRQALRVSGFYVSRSGPDPQTAPADNELAGSYSARGGFTVGIFYIFAKVVPGSANKINQISHGTEIAHCIDANGRSTAQPF